MHRKVIYKGRQYAIVFAFDNGYRCPACDFFYDQNEAIQSKLMALFKRLADEGKIFNREKFKKLEGEIFQFKCHQIRMPCAFRDNRHVLVTHGFIKKGDDTPPEEIQRARRILEVDHELCLIQNRDPQCGPQLVNRRKR